MYKMYNFLGSRNIIANQVRRSIGSARYVSTLDAGSALSKYKVGDVIHGYRLEQIEHIKELNVKPYFFRHEVTGAEHLHVHKDGDTNNVFNVSLRTTPNNSTGVAHVLEHLTLMGSQHYPIRDPFFKMSTRSLTTFLNAMTGPDFTSYPFSTQNEKDFENLLRVYLDAVFFPELKPVDFRQEAWRLEHEKPDDKDTPIVIKGIVYNEMKGAYSSSSSIYCRYLLKELLPDTTYQYESGGLPEEIPHLTNEEMKKFYKLHYHPSNAKFFTYGNFSFDNHLKVINELVLSKFNANAQAREQSFVNEQQFWSEPRKEEIFCPLDPLCAEPEKQTTTSISYLLPTLCTNHEDMFMLQILSTLLIDGPNAPFYKSLIESGLGSDYSPSTGLGSHTKQPYFSIGLQNIHPDDINKVHDIIESTFKETAAEGFPQERIDASLHDIELSMKHVSGNFGLRLAMNLESSWNHDGDVIDNLRVNKYVEKFQETLANNKDLWSKLIDKYFINNKHKLILNMNPDPTLEEKRKEQEKAIIQDKISKFDEVAKQTILYEGIELMKIQNTKEDLSVLPCLKPSQDISRDLPTKTKLKFDQHKGVHIQFCEQPTNEVVYFRAITEINEKLLYSDLVDYLPLFCDVATKLAVGKYNRQDFAQEVQLRTGGLNMSLLVSPDLEKFDNFKTQLMIGSHCLRRNIKKMFELWQEVFKQIHFRKDQEYLTQLIKSCAAELAEGVSDDGHIYSIKRASHKLSKISAFEERLTGLSYVARMKDVASKESIESVTSKLENIASMILDPFNMKCAVNAEAEAIDETSKELKYFIENTQKSHVEKIVPDPTEAIQSEERKDMTKIEDLKLPFLNHYVAKALIAVPKMHEDYPKIVIMSSLVSSKYLLREVREKGGAYGAGLRVSSSGIMNFYSYRDPRTKETLEIFDKVAEWIEDGSEYNEDDIEESKLSVFQKVDKPIAPGKRGIDYFSMGESDDLREIYRKRLLDVTIDDVKEVAAKYLNQENVGTNII